MYPKSPLITFAGIALVCLAMALGVGFGTFGFHGFGKVEEGPLPPRSPAITQSLNPMQLLAISPAERQAIDLEPGTVGAAIPVEVGDDGDELQHGRAW
jgi:hypothetical protein